MTLTDGMDQSEMERMEKVALVNARVFDGKVIGEPMTVVIENGLIGTDATGARTIDAQGATVLPGLIDAHVHLHGPESLEQLSRFGVTTALDMATWPPSLVDSLRGRRGLTDIRSAGTPATSPGSAHSRVPGYPAAGLVTGPDEAAGFVADRVAEGCDYIKLVADIPGPDQPTLDALTTASHEHGKRVIAHAVSIAAVRMALQAGVDMITHVPLDVPVDDAIVNEMLTHDRIAIPTLSMMEGIVEQTGPPGATYAAARDSVTALHRAGVRILAGTDANAAVGPPASITHGESLHHELELLVDAGLSTVEAIRAATSLPARCFGLTDRGEIAPGMRADLLLIDGDPTVDIRATRRIRHIWCGGVEYRA